MYKLTVLLAFFACSLATYVDLFPWLNKEFPKIGHADEAEIALLGRNIAEGKGAVVECYWLLHGSGHFTDKLPRPEGYWSLYVGYWFALFFKIFGASRTSLLLAASTCKTITAIVAFGVLWRLTRSGLASITGLCGVLFLPQMFARMNGYSDIEVTVAMTLSTLFLIKAWPRGPWVFWALSGLFAGIAMGVKPNGIISFGLLISFCLYSVIFLKEPIQHPLKGFAIGSAGFLLGVLPLWIYNYQASDTIFLPDFREVANAASQKIMQGVSHDQAFYNPELPAIRPLFSSKPMLVLKARNSSIYLLEYFNGTLIHPVWFVPFLALGLARSRHLIIPGSATLRGSIDRWVLACILLNIAGFLLSFFLDLEARYWNFLVPIHLIVTVYVMWSIHRGALVFALLVILGTSTINIAGVAKTTMAGSESARSRNLIGKGFTEANAVLPENAIVLCSDPWEFAFHTRRKSIMLPCNPKPEVLLKIADRFSADYIAIVNNRIRNDKLKDLLSNNPPEFLERIHRSDALVIFKIIRSDHAGTGDVKP